jgi:hypothetical protein
VECLQVLARVRAVQRRRPAVAAPVDPLDALAVSIRAVSELVPPVEHESIETAEIRAHG